MKPTTRALLFVHALMHVIFGILSLSSWFLLAVIFICLGLIQVAGASNIVPWRLVKPLEILVIVVELAITAYIAISLLMWR